MRHLLDTHSFLWFVLNDPQWSGRASRGILVFCTEAEQV
jgi:hypothetical protein